MPLYVVVAVFRQEGLLSLPRSYCFNLPNNLHMGASALKWGDSASFGRICSPHCSPDLPSCRRDLAVHSPLVHSLGIAFDYVWRSARVPSPTHDWSDPHETVSHSNNGPGFEGGSYRRRFRLEQMPDTTHLFSRTIGRNATTTSFF